jgi:hypothetical protein
MATDGMGRPSMQWKPRENKKVQAGLASTDLARLAPQNTKQKRDVRHLGGRRQQASRSVGTPYAATPPARAATALTQKAHVSQRKHTATTFASSERSTDQSVMADAMVQTPRVALRRSTRRLPASGVKPGKSCLAV